MCAFDCYLPLETATTIDDVHNQEEDTVDTGGDARELTFRQRLEMSMKASQCPSQLIITPPSDADKQRSKPRWHCLLPPDTVVVACSKPSIA